MTASINNRKSMQSTNIASENKSHDSLTQIEIEDDIYIKPDIIKLNQKIYDTPEISKLITNHRNYTTNNALNLNSNWIGDEGCKFLQQIFESPSYISSTQLESKQQQDKDKDKELEEEKEKSNAVKFQGKMLMACITGIEFLNNKFDPFDIKLDGWGEQINENIDDYKTATEEYEIRIDIWKKEISESFFKKRLSQADFKKTEEIIENFPEPENVFSRLERFPKIYENKNDKNFLLAHAILSEYDVVAVDNSGVQTLVKNILEFFGKWNKELVHFSPEILANIVQRVKFSDFLSQRSYKFIVKKAFSADYLNNYIVDFLDGLKGHCEALYIPVLQADFEKILFQERTAINIRSFARNQLSPDEFNQLQIALEKASEKFASAVYLLELPVFLGSYNLKLE